ncbi:MAG TPA: DUF4339 domain-containing protein [Chlamydiales bacterium]|nr:DUF4339 domain-containing protein [Chlamydiales bacterium]
MDQNIFYIIYVFLYSLTIAYFCKNFALKKNKNPKTWFWIGFLFGWIGLIILLLSKKRQNSSLIHKKPIPLLNIPNKDKLWYYVDSEKQQKGPLSFQRLQSLYQEKAISISTYVWNEAMDQWKKVSELMK